MWRTALFLGGTLIGVAILALYFVLGAPSPSELVGMTRGGTRIAPGFIGMASFDRWRLICIPGPFLDGAGPADAPAATAQQQPAKIHNSNSCRINQEMPAPRQDASAGEKPGQVLVATNFSLIGPRRTPAVMLRVPATARPGDAIGLRFDNGPMVQTFVRDCAAAECLAAGTLTTADWDKLSTAKSLQVSFPATGRQWVLLDLPLAGLSTAIAALTRAEIAPQS